MAKARKYTKQLISILLGLVLIQFVALAGLLVFVSGRDAKQEDAAAPTVEEPVAEQVQQESDGESAPEQMPEEIGEIAAEKEKPADERSAPEILSDHAVISHGMGMIEGTTTLNCLESFRQQYENGVRVFEVDLRMTRDLQVVLRHDWRAGWQDGISETDVPTLDEFRAKPLLGKYTPLTFRDLLLLMEEYPDICIITDTKFTDAEMVTVQFEAMLADARELGLSYLFDRMVVQVYNKLMFRVVDSIGDFPHYIYTLYAEGFNRTEQAFTDIMSFCTESGVMGVTMWDYWWKAEFAPIAGEYGVAVYVHTVNDTEKAAELMVSGVDGVYTDSIVPGELETARIKAEEEAARKAEGKLPSGEGDEGYGTDGEENIRGNNI